MDLKVLKFLFSFMLVAFACCCLAGGLHAQDASQGGMQGMPKLPKLPSNFFKGPSHPVLVKIRQTVKTRDCKPVDVVGAWRVTNVMPGMRADRISKQTREELKASSPNMMLNQILVLNNNSSYLFLRRNDPYLDNDLQVIWRKSKSPEALANVYELNPERSVLVFKANAQPPSQMECQVARDSDLDLKIQKSDLILTTTEPYKGHEMTFFTVWRRFALNTAS